VWTSARRTYKPNCPPAVLTKLPVIVTREMVRILLERYERCLSEMEEKANAR
jgi:hypothetical protein